MNLGNHYDSTPSVPTKRKRGRPRKDLSFFSGRISDGSQRSHSQNHGGSGHVPSGFGRANGNQPPHEVDPVGDPDDAMVGVAVTGVIEGAFDAGYLLSVRVGDSDTHLRGVVFKPGHYLPVTAENDVAPHVQMIRRNEVPLPSGIRTPVHGNSSRYGRKRNHNQHSMVLPLSVSSPPPSNQLVQYKGKQVSTTVVPAQLPPPTGSRGTVVPVVLQPVHSADDDGALPFFEAPPIASQPAHLAVSKAKQVYSHSLADHGLPSPPKSSQAVNDGSTSQSMEGGGANQSDSSAGRRLHHVKPFDQLVNEVAKRTTTTQVETQEESAKSKASGLTPEQIRGLSQPLLVKPLQAIRSDAPDQSLSIPRPRKGKMTELLLAVQENSIEKHSADAWHADHKSDARK
ncbi:hypothetical protein Dimus_012505 [Dionaea muscipula]